MGFLNDSGVTTLWSRIKSYLTGSHVQTTAVTGSTNVDEALTDIDTRVGHQSQQITDEAKRVNSNQNETTDVLALAPTCTKTTFFKTSGASAYTGVLPSNAFKTSTGVINIRGGGRFVLMVNADGDIATNYYNGSEWSGWVDISQQIDDLSTVTTGTIQTSLVTLQGETFLKKKNRNVGLELTFRPLEDIPAWTVFATIPEGFRPPKAIFSMDIYARGTNPLYQINPDGTIQAGFNMGASTQYRSVPIMWML